LTGGSYPVTLRDLQYPTCLWTGTLTIDIAAPAALVFDTESALDITCFGLINGQLITPASGGTGSLVYTITPGDSTNTSGTFVNLPAGDYTVQVTDGNLCGPLNTGTLTIAAPASALSFSLPMDTAFGASLDVSSYVTGGTQPYTYTINPDAAQDPAGTFTGLTSGLSYVITVQDANSCGEVNDTITIMTGIITLRNGEGLRMWPNPFRSELTLEITSPEYNRYEIEMLNSLGQVMKTWQVETQRGVMFRQQMEMSAMPGGIYLLKVKGENTVSSLRVIKN
jgi:hypothetical protein